MTFPRAPLTRRGYSEEAVHDALRRCAATLIELTQENDRLRTDMQRHRDWIRANNIGDGTGLTGVPTVDAVLQQARAQQAAENTVNVAREQARNMVRAARAQAEAILQQTWEKTTQAAAAGGPEETERLISYLRQIAESLSVTADEYAAKRAQIVPAAAAAAPRSIADHRTAVPPDHRTAVSPDHRTAVSPDHRTAVSPDHRTAVPPDHGPGAEREQPLGIANAVGPPGRDH